jgi:carboxyl-terminal processing protease
MRWRALAALVIGALSALAIVGVMRSFAVPPTPVPVPPVASAPKPDGGTRLGMEDEDKSPLLHPPTGKLPSLGCAAAHAIVAEVQAELAFAPTQPSASELSTAIKDWVDPHGHWAVAPDASPFTTLDTEAAALLAELSSGTTCPASLRVGRALGTWVDGERARFDQLSSAITLHGDVQQALTEALDVSGHDAGHDVGARALTEELASRVGSLSRALGAPAAKYVQAARSRYFPDMSTEAWAGVVLAATVRAWVEQVDAHGSWAPYGEEASVHDVDLDQDAPARLWARATRTVLGVRVDEAPLAPLSVGDVVLEVEGFALAGLGVEQLDELALTAADSPEPFDVVVMREGEHTPRIVRVDPDAPEPSGATAHPFDLTTETIPYGSGELMVVTIPDVYDDLGELFSRALLRARKPSLVGVVLDLRGNGGGSTEGAIDTLGSFLPGAHLFPMRSRDGTIETDRAPEPPIDQQWSGPVATLIDSGTASAAEMLAGALAAYRRGPSIGTSTYGKGCAQEYLDDDAHTGLLRVTTLLFALPDGSPVQRVGLTPTLGFPFGSPSSDDREAKLLHSPASWTGPDVRDRAWITKSPEFAWPSPAGHVGPCAEEAVCKAVSLLGEQRASRARARL